MKNFINSVTRTMINVGLGMVVTGSFVWVILLASNFNGW